MSLGPGSRVGPYEILAPLGAGGMGEIHRARDTRLGREVAIKGLPAAFSNDPERLARFDREAKVLASLNHANIGAIYGLEEVDGARYLVLELVEGETLARRLERGPLALRETLDVCSQIAAAVEAAHDRGIVHRDLKPANVMLTPSGGVKVLDFGLAKGDGTQPSADSSGSLAPTMAVSATAAGLVLGTAPYMSPEQARGTAVDRRTDVWALGCIALECLTGRQVFAGDTVSDVIARILEREPDWAAVPASTPLRLRDLLRRCLTKDAAERPRDIGDIRRELAAIARDLSSGSFPSAAGMTATPSLAVLYFENLAQDQESEYFCAGITEDILTDLSKIKGMRVASRHAVARYRGAPVDVARVAADLGVSSVLEGSVRRAGDRVRITAQLISAADGFHLWAERYDRTLQDVFLVQEEIAAAIASALRVKLTPSESQQIVQNRPADARAYDLYLKGRDAYGHYTAASLHQALDLFRQAIEVDPGYALAWAGVADCFGQMVQWQSEGTKEENLRGGLEAVERAIGLNPGLPEAYKAKGLILRLLGDRNGTRAALTRAVDLNPRFVPAIINLGVESICDADLAGAERFMKRALEVDVAEPFATTWICFLAMLEGREQEALAAARRLRELTEDPFYVTVAHLLPIWFDLRRGDLEAAERRVAQALTDSGDPANMSCVSALIAVRSGRTEQARRILADLSGARNLGAASLMLAASAALRLGDPDGATSFMAREILADLAPVLIRLDPEIHALADRPPFSPRHSGLTLVWPVEGPMMPASVHALFREVRIESGFARPAEISSTGSRATG